MKKHQLTQQRNTIPFFSHQVICTIINKSKTYTVDRAISICKGKYCIKCENISRIHKTWSTTNLDWLTEEKIPAHDRALLSPFSFNQINTLYKVRAKFRYFSYSLAIGFVKPICWSLNLYFSLYFPKQRHLFYVSCVGNLAHLFGLDGKSIL